MKILIAEQDRDFSSAFSALLGLDDHEVTAVYDGTQVLTGLEDGQSFDIAVIDEELPRINAYGLLEPLHKKNIPVIVITSVKLTASKLVRKDLPEAYIVLPFLPCELLELIERVYRKKKSSEVLETEGVSVSVSDFLLCGSIPVTDGESELFASLAGAEQVDGKRFGSYISSLNHKLGQLGISLRIKYLKDKGYRMVNDNYEQSKK